MAKLLDLIPALQNGKSVSHSTMSSHRTICKDGEQFLLTDYRMEGEWAEPEYLSLEKLKQYPGDGWEID